MLILYKNPQQPVHFHSFVNVLVGMCHYERTEILLSFALHFSISVWQVLAKVFEKPDSSLFPWTFLKIDLVTENKCLGNEYTFETFH